MSPNQNAVKLAMVISAWESLAPGKVFAGLTLDQFKLALKPSSDARTSINDLNNQMLLAKDTHDDADKESLRLVLLVVGAVKADLTEGEDGALYEAMGYVRKSERKSGLTRSKKPVTPA